MNWHRGFRVVSEAVALTLLILALVSAGVFAKHVVVVSNLPLGADLSTPTTFTLSVDNLAGGGNKPINQVDLVADASWIVAATGDQPTPPTGWSVDVTGQTITWSGSEIAVGSSQDFGWEATTASSIGYSSHSWTTTDIVAATNSGTVGTVLSDWESYDDDIQSNVWGTVPNPYDTGTETVFMYGGGFEASQQYYVGFYDASASPNIAATTSPSSDASGTLSTQYLLTTDPLATPGTWHAVVYIGTPPSTYDSGDPLIVADDAFEVTLGAIPEFPTVIAGIAVAGLCAAIYFWMRRRAVDVKA